MIHTVNWVVANRFNYEQCKLVKDLAFWLLVETTAVPTLIPCHQNSSQQHPLPLGDKEGIKPGVQEMQEQGVVINTHSPLYSPVWPVRKPNRTW